MAERTPPLLSAEELEASRADLGVIGAAIAQLPPGLVKQRMDAALKGVDAEIQSQLWGHLRSKSGTADTARERGPSSSVGLASTTGSTAGPAPGGGGGGGGGAERKKMPSDSPTGAILNLAYRASVTPRSALHAAALALHCLLIREGCVCTGQDDKAGAVRGFAAPVRDIPEEKLVPDRWDADTSALSFRYRRPDKPGKVYLFKAAGSASSPAPGKLSGGKIGPTQFFLGEKGGEIVSADVDLEPLERCSPDFLESEDFFETLFSVFRREVLSSVVPSTRVAPATPDGTLPSTGGSTEDSGKVNPARDGRPLSPAGRSQPAIPRTAGEDDDDPLRAGPPRFAGPAGVGPTPFIPGRGGDFGGDLFPGSVGGPVGGGGGGLPGAGGLLGPGHPMFGGGGGAGYMEPRFDPYGPPMPGQPWGPGVPGRGAGRGGPAQGGPRGPPGGPDNDHLPPPGGSSNMFF